ncbi:hypothetical protein [Actinocrispum wychmicini]|uniref:Protein kinase domain-containing protein n=1 Tax=Actinocrispum wychmicini TaxID=1213861 RepID=A0A4R2J4W0_9PSEU|nr:hypothetical protein [Actinocrispum wychmicini]TCO52877.1 hypothetical protein EV192_11171 [Actinocrispum wychmicini]
MAEEKIELVPYHAHTVAPTLYTIDFNGSQRQASGIRYRLGHNVSDGPVAHKIAVDKAAAERRLRRELEVAQFLETRGGELLSKCLRYNFDSSPVSTVVSYRGRPLADLARDPAGWPLAHPVRRKIITDLLQAVELLRVSSIVHGAISMDTLHWDGSSLQIVDFGQAALSGEYPDGRRAHHGDDVVAAGRVIYHVHVGQPPPDDRAALRRQIEEVQDIELRDLLLRRDLVAGADIDYVFAPDPGQRPTTRDLLNRLDRRPHGVQWQQLLGKEEAVRDEFRGLRGRQARFRADYTAWANMPRNAGRQATTWASLPRPTSSRSSGEIAAVVIGAVGVIVALIVILAVLL